LKALKYLFYFVGIIACPIGIISILELFSFVKVFQIMQTAC